MARFVAGKAGEAVVFPWVKVEAMKKALFRVVAELEEAEGRRLLGGPAHVLHLTLEGLQQASVRGGGAASNSRVYLQALYLFLAQSSSYKALQGLQFQRVEIRRLVVQGASHERSAAHSSLRALNCSCGCKCRQAVKSLNSDQINTATARTLRISTNIHSMLLQLSSC